MHQSAEERATTLVPDNHAIDYCVGSSAFNGSVENREGTWAEFVEWLTTDLARIEVTTDEYHALPKEHRNNLKDGEVFVAGRSLDGRRTGGSFTERTMLFVDVDSPRDGFEPSVNREMLKALWEGSCPVLSGIEYVVHPTTSSRRDLVKFHLLIPLEHPLPSDEAILANEGLLLSLEAAHEGVAADRSGLSQVRPLYKAKLARDALKLHAKRNRGQFPDVARFIAVATKHRADEAAAAEASRQTASDEQRDSSQQRAGGFPDDTAEICARFREVLEGLNVLIEPIRSGAASRHVLASECPVCRGGIAHADWTSDGRWFCRTCPPGTGGNVITFVKRLEGIEGNEAFRRCRELLGMPSRTRAERERIWSETDAHESWDDPEPLPEAVPAPSLYDDCGDGRAWLDVAFPAPFARYIRAVARGNELSPGVVAAMSLPALALAVGPDVTARGNAMHSETVSFWSFAIEPPGNRKSAGAKAATEPLAALAVRIEEDGARLRAEWATRHAQREAEIASIKKTLSAHYDAKSSGKKTTKSLTSFELDRLSADLTDLNKAESEDPIPGPFELLTTNPTPEAVVERVASLRRYGAFAAEGATILQGVAEYRDKGNSGAPVGHWCSIYSGDDVSVARKGKPALNIPAGSAILCVGLTVQPSVLARAMADAVLVGQGFLARFLKFPAGNESFVESEAFPQVDEAAIAWWSRAVAAVAARPSASPVQVRCDDEAAALLRKFELEMERRSRDESDLGDNDSLRAWARKAHGLALRIAVYFHALGGCAYDREINEETMLTAITLARYGLAVEVALETAHGNNRFRRLCRLDRLIAESGMQEVTPRVVEKKGWCSLSISDARAYLRELAEYRHVREVHRQNPNGGPTSVVFLVNPKLVLSVTKEGPGKTGKTRQHPTYEQGCAGFAAEDPAPASEYFEDLGSEL